MPTLSSPVAPQVVIRTSCGTSSDDNVGITVTLNLALRRSELPSATLPQAPGSPSLLFIAMAAT